MQHFVQFVLQQMCHKLHENFTQCNTPCNRKILHFPNITTVVKSRTVLYFLEQLRAMENLRERFDVMHVTLANFSSKVCPNFVRGQVAQNFAQCNSAFPQKMLARVNIITIFTITCTGDHTKVSQFYFPPKRTLHTKI